MIRSWTGSLSACLALAFLAHAPGAAQEQSWTLTTADFNARRVRLVSLAEQGAGILEPDGQSAHVAPDKLVRLDRAGAGVEAEAQEPGAAFVLHLRSGDRLHGMPVRLTETAMVFAAPPLGEVDVPLEQLLALVAREADTGGAWRQPAPPADRLILANADQMTGFLAGIEGEQWTFADEQGNETPLNPQAVHQVRFADPGVPAAPAAGSWRIRLTGGSLLSLEKLSFESDRFAFGYGGREVQVPETAVAWIEPVNGPVRWLADLAMLESRHTPYFGAAFPSLAEAPEAGSRSFVVRSRSVLVFELPAGYDRFRTRYAVDRTMTQGSVDVRILLDDRVVHERKALTAADTPEPVEVPLDGAARLTLEVDYGPGLDVQDVVHWVDPALVRGG